MNTKELFKELYDIRTRLSTLEEFTGYSDFMSPVPVKTGSDKVRELLKKGKPVLCGVSDASQEIADVRADNISNIAAIVSDAVNSFIESRGVSWKYTSPVDLSKFAHEVE